MRGAGSLNKFLNIWLNKLTNAFNNYSKPVASIVTKNTFVNSPIAKLDSGASQHYLKPTHNTLLTNRTIRNGPSVTLPNNQSLQVTEQGNLNLHKNLPYEASRAYILPNLSNESLLSVGQLCDNNCTVLFDKYFCNIRHKDKLILQGKRNFDDRLYDVPLSSHNNLHNSNSNNNNLKLNYVTKQDKTRQNWKWRSSYMQPYFLLASRLFNKPYIMVT